MDIVNYMTSHDILKKLRAQSYYRYIQVAKMMLRHKCVFTLVQRGYGDHAGSKRMGISHLDDIRLNKGTMYEWLFLFERASISGRTKISQLHFTHLHSTEARISFWRSLGLYFLMAVRTLHWKLLLLWTRLCPVRARQAFSWCRCFWLYLCSQLWLKRQERSLEGSLWNLLAADCPIRANGFLRLCSAQLKALVIGNAADPIPCTTWKRLREHSRDYFEREDIIVVPEGLSKRSWKDQDLLVRSTATINANNLKNVNKGKDEEDDYRKNEQDFYDRQGAPLLSGTKEQAQFDERFCLSGWETSGFHWTIVTINWNFSSRLCRHILMHAWHRKTIARVSFSPQQMWSFLEE